jgi:hypothetical protein
METNQQESLKTEKQEQKTWLGRRYRRGYLKSVGILEAKRNLNVKSWFDVVSKNIAEGNKKSEDYSQIILDLLESQLSSVEQRLRLTCSTMGYDKDKTDKYIQTWMDGLKPWPNN